MNGEGRMDKMPCLPVKITDKKWADSLQDGQVFMRSLYDYGIWSVTEQTQNKEEMKSGIQGDIGEGIVRRVDPKIGDNYFNRFSPQLRNLMKSCYYIDYNQFQYEKVFCMYGLTYLTDKNCYEKPDDRLKEFGNTAVVIFNPNEFLRRVMNGLYNQFGDSINFKLDEMHYYPPSYYGALDEFCKSEAYAWQNELRMRVAILDPNEYIIDEKGRKLYCLIKNTDSIIVDIGDIRDISVQISVEDLIDLKLPSQALYRAID